MTQLCPLITAADLKPLLGRPDLRIVDASWHLDGRDGRVDFERERIPGAVFFDLEAGSDRSNPLPHMLPTAEAFAAHVSALGIGDQDDIVVYDTPGLVSAARIWWMFRTFGADRVRVLDGGLPAWRAAGGALESGSRTPLGPASFRAHLDADAVADRADVAAAPDAGIQILDARSAGRFAGTAPEPRPGLRGGHMPGACNLPFAAILTPDSTMKRGAALEAAFAAAGIDPDRPVITSCGSGVTAAILSLGLAVLGRPSRVYDGSWTEWGGRDDTAIETSPIRS
ncbi:3-mercaptopyruvate sulfurtransferase [Brevundimonas sp.]|uniref:3-mercaptopyruvate sulfurtransferase n=1 Tax=Brevundimonas sp. TaxID=1871086 RepID=UPI0024876AC0|nr:3-mercaptopyruvate sulfurtransferase [Brevundimonas sp.]MDI1280751.1 3-mercaptopyruvate sulfurtransferase [Brevundimonas sp.]